MICAKTETTKLANSPHQSPIPDFYYFHDFCAFHYNHEFMLDQIEKVYEPYKSEEGYDYIINKRRVNRLLAAAKAGNKRLAWEILKKVPFRYQSMKTFKALLHICKPSL